MLKSHQRNHILVWLFLLTYVVISLIYAFATIDTWDDDCPTRYYNTVNAFNDPIHFVSLWNRPLFTLIFAIPLQFGKFMIPIMMVLISAVSAYYLYRALLKQGIKHAAFIIPLLLFQTYFFGISRNAETEPLAVAIFCLGYYFMVEKKWFWFALMAGLLPLARLELCVLFPFWAFQLYREKQLKLVLIMILPMFLWNLAGAIITGNLTYLIDQTIGADNEKNRYGHTTFGHYFQRYIYAVGPVFFFFFILGLLKTGLTKIQYKGFVFLQFCAGFFVYVLFSWKLNMGNAAGFMRNLTPLSTLAAIIALYGFNYWVGVITARFRKSEGIEENEEFNEISEAEFQQLNRKKRQAYLVSKSRYEAKLEKREKKERAENVKQKRRAGIKYTLFIGAIILLILLTYQFFTLFMRNHHKLVEDTEYYINLYVILGLAGFTLVWFFIDRMKSISTYVPLILIAFSMIFFTAYTEPPNKELTDERQVMTDVSDVFKSDYFNDRTKYVNHIWFYWANDFNKYGEDFKGVTMVNLDSAKIGSICVWENHYSHRLSGDVTPEYFTKHPEWVRLSYYVAKSTGFRAEIFEKVDTSDSQSGVEAIKSYAALDSLHSDSWICMANYLKTVQKDPEGSMVYFDKAIDLDSTNHNGWFNRGVVWFEQKDYKQSEHDFRKSIEIKPKWADAWVNLGAAFANLGQTDSAIRAYTKAIEFNDKKGSAYRNRGKMYQAQQDTMLALGDYNNYLKIRKNDVEILWRRAQLYAGLKSWKAAASDARQVLKLQPTIKEAWLLLGVANLALDQKEEAKKALLKAKELGHPRADMYLAAYFPQ